MERIDELVSRKREIFRTYKDGVAGVAGISMNPEPPGTQNGFWMPTVVFEGSTGLTSERITGAFAAENIDARVFFHPLSTTPPFAGSSGGRWAGEIPDRAINVPSFHDITEIEQRRVVQVVRQLCAA
jgi:perosamine synthetase